MILSHGHFTKLILATVVLVAGVSAAAAQAPDSKACAQHRTTVGAGDQLTVENKNGKETTLSDKLAKSDGVICPPVGVDNDIKAPTPQGGKMPVIPPPGTPQNQPDVRPK